MTKAEAKAEQERLVARGFDLSMWYGTWCNKCCDVYPKFEMEIVHQMSGNCWYECPVCGKKSTKHLFPYQAKDAWNAGHFQQQQLSLEGF